MGHPPGGVTFYQTVFRKSRRYIPCTSLTDSRGRAYSPPLPAAAAQIPGGYVEWPVVLADVSYVVGRVHLNLESIWIIELERFFRSFVRELQVKF
jgi:hypothetical protein